MGGEGAKEKGKTRKGGCNCWNPATHTPPFWPCLSPWPPHSCCTPIVSDHCHSPSLRCPGFAPTYKITKTHPETEFHSTPKADASGVPGPHYHCPNGHGAALLPEREDPSTMTIRPVITTSTRVPNSTCHWPSKLVVHFNHCQEFRPGGVFVCTIHYFAPTYINTLTHPETEFHSTPMADAIGVPGLHDHCPKSQGADMFPEKEDTSTLTL